MEVTILAWRWMYDFKGGWLFALWQAYMGGIVFGTGLHGGPYFEPASWLTDSAKHTSSYTLMVWVCATQRGVRLLHRGNNGGKRAHRGHRLYGWCEFS